ncbi:MAG: universal stress protein [Bacteroidetes bacterium]|nr:universal stress protein [Bacteroidota bacterium]
MRKYYKILLATDYSDAVINAERYAVQFAKNINAIITFFHAYNSPLPPPKITMSYEETLQKFKTEEMKKLIQHRNDLFRSLNINHDKLISECVVKDGSAGNKICKYAKESNADFIIIGSHGESGFRDVLFGSHTWNVIKKSLIPVIIVPKDALFTGIKNIVFGTEYREGEISALNFLAQFSKQLEAELIVLHVTNYVLSKAFEKEMFEKFKNDIEGKISYKKLKMRLIKNDNLIDGLNKFCENERADLLVMAPEKQILFEKIFLPSASSTRKMSFHSTIPLMTIPD